MRSNTVRVIAGVAAVALIVVLLVVLKGGSDSKDPTTSATTTAEPTGNDGAQRREEREQKTASKPAIPVVVVRDGEPVGGLAELSYDQGQQVRFKVSSDVTDEIHVHGYDISREVEAGGSANLEFTADIEGIFEVELEERAVPIAELTVNP